MDPVGPSNILGCVLAGGLSRRMAGRDKAFAEFGGRTLAARAAARIAPQVAATIISANGDLAPFAGLALAVVPDTIAGHAGPLAGILAGLCHAREHLPGISHMVSVATDTPFFPLELVDRLAAAADTPSTIVLAASGDQVHSVFGLWPVDMADDLDSWLKSSERRSVRAFAESRAMTTVRFEPVAVGATTVDPFLNVNTPEELEHARSLLQIEG